MRVIYRGDLDGIVSAAILMDVGLCDELVQAHPKDMQAGKVDVQEGDAGAPLGGGLGRGGCGASLAEPEGGQAWLSRRWSGLGHAALGRCWACALSLGLSVAGGGG